MSFQNSINQFSSSNQSNLRNNPESMYRNSNFNYLVNTPPNRATKTNNTNTNTISKNENFNSPENITHKITNLKKAFVEINYDDRNDLNQEKLLYFLNKRTNDDNFPLDLSKKIFQMLRLDGIKTVKPTDFIRCFLTIESDLNKNIQNFTDQLNKERLNIKGIDAQIAKYKREKINGEGFSENPYIRFSIVDIDFRKKLEGIKSIKLVLNYNSESKETEFKLGKNYGDLVEKFEWIPTSKNDNLEIVMYGINDHKHSFLIGRKLFLIDNISGSEEYDVVISIPELDNLKVDAAYVKAKIVVFLNDLHYYERKKKNSMNRIFQLENALDKINYYLKKMNEVYIEKPRNVECQFNNDIGIKITKTNNF